MNKNNEMKDIKPLDGGAVLVDSGGEILHQCKHVKMIKLSNGIEISFFYNEKGRSFSGQLLYQGIPHVHEISKPQSHNLGFEMVKQATPKSANEVLDAILGWPSMEAISKQDVIGHWN